jgi:DUF4097 and DUF4098 domain-containing protein YvlB
MNGGIIKNDVGDITVDNADGNIDLATSVGSITVREYIGDNFSLSTDTGSAAIQISGSGPLDGSIRTDTGDISCDISQNRSTAARLQTDVGTISLSGITDYTKSGFVSVEAGFSLGAAGGNLTMETGTGDIRVKVF